MMTPTTAFSPAANMAVHTDQSAEVPDASQTKNDDEFRKVFHQFVGTTLYGQMLKSMRATQEKNPYFHGGRAEEIFQSQLDEKLVDKLSEAGSRTVSEPMFQLMTINRGKG
jgi:Rod binding domain-containing protein